MKRPTRIQAEEAVRTLLQWAGDNPLREGLKETPARVVQAFEEYFSGYSIDAGEYLTHTFEEVGGYDEIVSLRHIPFDSHCEHHLSPIIGKAHVAYIPRNRVVGISKLARVVDIFAKRLQIQEKMTAEIANAIQETLNPLGVAVVIEAVHHCMTTRGIHKQGTSMVTQKMTGVFKEQPTLRQEFFSLISPSSLS